MRASNEIIAEHTSEDGETVDIEAATADLMKELKESGVGISPSAALEVLRQHVESITLYLGGVLFDVLERMGALPAGIEEEMVALQKAVRFDLSVKQYDMVRLANQERLRQASNLWSPS